MIDPWVPCLCTSVVCSKCFEIIIVPSDESDIEWICGECNEDEDGVSQPLNGVSGVSSS